MKQPKIEAKPVLETIKLKSIKFQTELIIGGHLVKGVSLEDYTQLQMHDNYVSFKKEDRYFMVPFSNVNLMERV